MTTKVVAEFNCDDGNTEKFVQMCRELYVTAITFCSRLLVSYCEYRVIALQPPLRGFP